jgi:3-dehydroquinate dehydratase-2
MNMLGERPRDKYGSKTLAQVEAIVASRAKELGVEVKFFQSNHEGELVEFVQQNARKSNGIIINPAGLTHYGWSLQNAVAECGVSFVEVHVGPGPHSRETGPESIFSGTARAYVAGMRYMGYVVALEFLVALHNKEVE